MLDSSTLNKSDFLDEQEQTEGMPTYKILLIGEIGVGKTSIKSRYIDNIFEENTKPNVTLDFQTKVVQVTPVTCVKLIIWDTAGSEKYRSIARSYFTNCQGIIICYDITNRKSFNTLDFWIDLINEYVQIGSGTKDTTASQEKEIEKNVKDKDDSLGDNIFEWDEENEEDFKDDNKMSTFFALVGNKLDLEKNRQVAYEEGKKYAEKIGCEFYETSAKTGEGVEDMFFDFAKDLFAKISFDTDEYKYSINNTFMLKAKNKQKNQQIRKNGSVCC